MNLSRYLKNTKKKAGLPPGTVIYTGKQKVDKQTYDIFDYTFKAYTEKTSSVIKDLYPYKDKKSISWLNINGLHDTKSIEQLGEQYAIHPLILEDITNIGQRPTIEEHDHYVFITFKMLTLDKEIEQEHVSLIITKNNVLSFQEKKGDIFEQVRERMRAERWREKKRGADYVGYALLDAAVDHYFVILEELGERIQSLEEELHKDLKTEVLSDIHRLKRELIFLRKSIWPLREVVSKLQKSDLPLIDGRTKPFLSDLYDHTVQVIDTIESYRDIVGGLLDYYLSATSNKMNEVMKVLTIFAAIFIPLTFFAGIYGMNFDHLPELHWRYSYFALWGVFLVMAGGMLYYFKRKRWI